MHTRVENRTATIFNSYKLQCVISLDVPDKTSIVRTTLQSDASDVTVQQHIAKYHDEWPQIEAFFDSKIKIINADREVSTVYNQLEEEIFKLMNDECEKKKKVSISGGG